MVCLRVRPHRRSTCWSMKPCFCIYVLQLPIPQIGGNRNQLNFATSKKKGWHIESGFVSDSSPANVWVPKNSGATWHLAVGLSGLGHLCKGFFANTSKVKDVKCIIWISIWSKCLCLNVAFCRCAGSALPSWFAVIQVALICILRCILPCIASCHRNSLKILSAHLVVT